MRNGHEIQETKNVRRVNSSRKDLRMIDGQIRRWNTKGNVGSTCDDHGWIFLTIWSKKGATDIQNEVNNYHNAQQEIAAHLMVSRARYPCFESNVGTVAPLSPVRRPTAARDREGKSKVSLERWGSLEEVTGRVGRYNSCSFRGITASSS